MFNIVTLYHKLTAHQKTQIGRFLRILTTVAVPMLINIPQLVLLAPFIEALYREFFPATTDSLQRPSHGRE